MPPFLLVHAVLVHAYMHNASEIATRVKEGWLYENRPEKCGECGRRRNKRYDRHKFITEYIAAYIQGLYKGARVHPTSLIVNQGCSQVSTGHANSVLRPVIAQMLVKSTYLHVINRS